ncbi:hypothetical protein GO998_07200 [Ralstonia syzygii]|uniref:Uncharacterized protein n=1 Tax=Ralstonia syzygii TaxID=28097 RepID=A0ABX7ZDZ8_9RALS|nr:hypothetical protein [Ralstonia syzygii]QUP53566.1 hypothetical protein GO998_07200 [Ralstonia syzygii]
MATQDFEAAPTDRAGEHPLIRRTRQALAKLDDQIVDLERQREEMEERVRRGLPREILWGVFDDRRKEGGVIAPSPGTLSVMVTPAARERALAVMNALIQLLEERKLRIWAPGATLIGRGKYTFVLRLSEITEKEPGQRRSPMGTIEWQTTGRLRITLREGPVGDFRIRDEAELSIEDQLSTLVDYVQQAIGKAPELQRRRDLAIRAQRDEAERSAAVRAEAERIEAEHQRRLSEEAARRKDLMDEMAQWRESERLRAYVDAVLGHAGTVEPGSAVDQWIQWARGVADAIDPIPKRLEGFGGGPLAGCPSEQG